MPVKAGPFAKSRLGASPQVAAAIAEDTVRAAAACSAVHRIVLVGGAEVAAGLRRGGSTEQLIVQIPESDPGAGLNPALLDGLGMADPGSPTAVMLGDLPALRPESLDRALGEVLDATTGTASAAFVPDAEGTGTVLLAARRPDLLVVAFGPGSAGAHEELGAVRLDLDLPDLRRDVDTPADLEQARRLGLGPATERALRGVDLPGRARTA